MEIASEQQGDGLGIAFWRMKQLLSVYSVYKSVVQIFVSRSDNFLLVNIFMKPIFFFKFFVF